jgi:hypothetical protein
MANSVLQRQSGQRAWIHFLELQLLNEVFRCNVTKVQYVHTSKQQTKCATFSMSICVQRGEGALSRITYPS